MDLGCGDFGEVTAVHDHHGPQGACPEAVHGLQAEEHVGGGFAGRYPQLALEFLGDPRPAAYMARRALAAEHYVLALGLQAELVIERGGGVYFHLLDAELLCHSSQGILRQISVLRLDVTKDGDQRRASSAVRVHDPYYLLWVGVFGLRRGRALLG